MEEHLILLSWISEYAYCKRRFYLRVFEQNNTENGSLIEGRIAHQRADQAKIEKRGSLVKVTHLAVYSEKYQMYGICDSVEFIQSSDGVYVDFLNGTYKICPIEYKHGKSRDELEYNLQLVAQAICLEEMFQACIEKGYIYYTGQKDRKLVSFDSTLRKQVSAAVTEIRAYLQNPQTILPEYKKRCPRCSLYEICAPKNVMAQKYLERIWNRYVHVE